MLRDYRSKTDKTCTIINNDRPFGTLRVIVNVRNDDGGQKMSQDFRIRVSGNNPSDSVFRGTASPGGEIRIGPGTYRITEDIDPRYKTIYSAGCQGSILVRQIRTCTITNNDLKDVPMDLISPKPVLIPREVETLKFGRSLFPANGTIVLASVAPMNITGGHVLLNIPSSDIKLVAARITGLGVEHAVTVPLVKTFDPRTGETLYEASLRSMMVGTNPFTGKVDNVTRFTDLLLWNSDPQSVSFDEDHGASITITFGGS